MKATFMKIKNKLNKAMTSGPEYDMPNIEEEYVELSTDSKMHDDSKLTVKPFTLESFQDIKPILDSLRDGYTIGFVNIKPLREKDVIELKRAINKLKKTCDAIQGDIAGLGEDWVIVAPSFVEVWRPKKSEMPISNYTEE